MRKFGRLQQRCSYGRYIYIYIYIYIASKVVFNMMCILRTGYISLWISPISDISTRSSTSRCPCFIGKMIYRSMLWCIFQGVRADCWNQKVTTGKYSCFSIPVFEIVASNDGWSPLQTTTGWWFGTFSIFPYIGNSNPNWLIFFTRVGIPPTRPIIIK